MVNKEGYGLAFDIGTTTVVGVLWDFNHLKELGTLSKTNPQRNFGADVISRISYSNRGPEALLKLQQVLISCLNEIIEELCKAASIGTDEIRKITMVGNTTMSHLLLGADPASLALAPFTTAFTGQVEKLASDLSLEVNPQARVVILPNLAGHVGGDMTGVLLAVKAMDLSPDLRLIIDIGTNGELALVDNGSIAVCSTAAGPAFEGGALQKGMRAAKGAIERVAFFQGRVMLGVIGGGQPIGICGSGAVDAVAWLLQAGIIDEQGTFQGEEALSNGRISEELKGRIRKGEKGKEFVLAAQTANGDIVITQKDVREIQMAKAAIYGGAILLLQHFNKSFSDIDEILLAGAFGNYIRKESAIAIGLLPTIPIEKITSIGNAAVTGASMALLSEEELKKAQIYPTMIEHIELALHPAFQEEYLKGMYFPVQR